MTQTDPPRRRRRWPWLVGGLALVFVALVAWQPSRVTFQTLALVPSILDLGPQPLALAPEPRHELIDYRESYQPGARRFDVGERSNFALLPAAIVGLEQLLAWGQPAICRTLAARWR